MTVTVTRRDIVLGERNSPCECPVARAIKRAFGVDYVDVRPSFSYGSPRVFLDSSHARVAPLPDVAATFARAFDDGAFVDRFRAEPFSFELEVA